MIQDNEFWPCWWLKVVSSKIFTTQSMQHSDLQDKPGPWRHPSMQRDAHTKAQKFIWDSRDGAPWVFDSRSLRTIHIITVGVEREIN